MLQQSGVMLIKGNFRFTSNPRSVRAQRSQENLDLYPHPFIGRVKPSAPHYRTLQKSSPVAAMDAIYKTHGEVTSCREA
jgi:hypothetical protein